MTPQEYEAEIARLTQGYEDLKEFIEANNYEERYRGGCEEYVVNAEWVLGEINKIIGNEK